MKSFKKILSAGLAALMCAGTMGTAVMAEEIIDGNIWYGDEVSVDITAGTEGYTWMSLFHAPISGYEFAGHYMGAEGPQTFVIVDTQRYGGTTWSPDGLYVPNESNYEVVYCCDVDTMIGDKIYYKRMNLEDSEYYNAEQAAKLRAVMTNSYPYVTVGIMKENLKKEGFTGADELTRNDIIAAVQTAVWRVANSVDAETLKYKHSYRVTDNYQWGQPVHDISAESSVDVSGTRNFFADEGVGNRINALVEHLLGYNATYAEKNQIIITDLDMSVGSPIPESEDLYNIELTINLNNSGSGDDDDVNIAVYVGDDLIKSEEVLYGQETYTIEVTAKKDAKIKAVVSGTQVLPRGVYFYAPKPADTNGDGIATGREVSQNLVGVSMGATSVYDEAVLGEGIDQDARFTKTYTAVNGGTNPAETFTFTYEADEVKENSSITKEMMPKISPSAVTFTEGSATSTQTVNVDLSDIDWPGVGVYYYKVTEVEGNTLGVEYDDDVPTLKITVAYDEGSDTYYTAFVSLNANRNGVTTGDKTHGFENKYKAGDLTVTKNVTGNLGDLSKEFEVTVTFTNTTGMAVRSDITYESNIDGEERGSVKFADGVTQVTIPLKLKNGETVTFSNIPYCVVDDKTYGITYKVEEADYTDAGYEAKYKLNGGKDTTTPVEDKIDSSDESVVITNTKDTTVDTGISVDSIPYIVMLGAAMFGGTGFMISKKRRSED
ncbi:MAG: Cys-Gln thioester bond-forming surface protein [Clostridia bacterium]|nr:Cys-Gln thioester bond-forming surface protein [Clostridia bacterium]